MKTAVYLLTVLALWLLHDSAAAGTMNLCRNVLKASPVLENEAMLNPNVFNGVRLFAGGAQIGSDVPDLFTLESGFNFSCVGTLDSLEIGTTIRSTMPDAPSHPVASTFMPHIAYKRVIRRNVVVTIMLLHLSNGEILELEVPSDYDTPLSTQTDFSLNFAVVRIGFTPHIELGRVQLLPYLGIGISTLIKFDPLTTLALVSWYSSEQVTVDAVILSTAVGSSWDLELSAGLVGYLSGHPPKRTGLRVEGRMSSKTSPVGFTLRLEDGPSSDVYRFNQSILRVTIGFELQFGKKPSN